MLNDREDKYESPEDSEYHFSDDDVSYEVDTETETPKPVVATEQKESFVARLSRSRRMLIAVVVFLALVFIVYRMVSPTTPVGPPTDITPDVQPLVSTQQINVPTRPGAVTTTSTVQTTAPDATRLVEPTSPTITPTSPQVTVTTVAPTPSTGTTLATTTTTPASTTTSTTQPATTTVSTTSATTSPVALQLPQGEAAQQIIQPVATGPQPSAATPEQLLQKQQTALTGTTTVTTPTVTTSTSTTVPTPTTQPIVATEISSQVPVTQLTTTSTGPAPTTVTANLDTGIATMAATNEKLMTQLQADYSQKLNDFASQNKEIEQQLQSLSTRVASMETQMNQLIQALNRQTQQTTQTIVNTPSNGTALPTTPTTSQPAPVTDKLGYNVQAIIPGRAWLRSDNGDTVTVAEGDSIKDVGRVTKIDPYDGIVEINTGNRTVSLSYGNSG